MDLVVDALIDEAAHVVIYAERGRGKTSLTNLVVEQLRRSGFVIGRYVCNAESDFEQIARGLVADLPASLLVVDPAATPYQYGQGCSAVLPPRPVIPGDIADIPIRLAGNRLIFVIDEFDRVQDESTRTKLADTIKLVSDRSLKLLFLIVGVSDTLDRIIGQHPSIERNIVGLHLPLLDDSDIRELLTAGSQAAGIAFSEQACQVVAGVARGMPHMAHVMGLRIVQHAKRRGAAHVSQDDVVATIEDLLDRDLSDIGMRYETMIDGASRQKLHEALRAAIAVRQDRWGRSPSAALPANVRDILLQTGIYEASVSAPSMLQPLDRRLIYHVLLQDAHARLTQPQLHATMMAAEKDTAYGD